MITICWAGWTIFGSWTMQFNATIPTNVPMAGSERQFCSLSSQRERLHLLFWTEPKVQKPWLQIEREYNFANTCIWQSLVCSPFVWLTSNPQNFRPESEDHWLTVLGLNNIDLNKTSVVLIIPLIILLHCYWRNQFHKNILLPAKPAKGTVSMAQLQELVSLKIFWEFLECEWTTP